MITVAIREQYTDILSVFGNLEEAVNIALQRFVIEQITAKINELRRRDTEYRNRYGCNYSEFSQRVAEDSEFIGHIESDVSKLWEADLADWEFCHKGVRDWAKKLQSILII